MTDLWPKTNRLKFSSDLDPDPGWVCIQDQFFHFSITVLDIKYELKELQMNIYDIIWRIGLRQRTALAEV